MAYRVGYQCIASKEMADDLVMSGVSPILMQDGTIKRPQKVDGGWVYNGNRVTFDYPDCSPVQQFTDGFVTGSQFLGVLLIIITFRLIYRMIYNVGGGFDAD